MNETDAGHLVNLLAAQYQHQAPNPARMAALVQALAGCEAADATVAAVAWWSREKFFPSVAELLEEYLRAKGAAVPGPEAALLAVHDVRRRRRDLAGRAWKMDPAARAAAFAEIAYSHPLVQRLAEQCGASEIGGDFRERVFLRAYGEARTEALRAQLGELVKMKSLPAVKPCGALAAPAGQAVAQVKTGTRFQEYSHAQTDEAASGDPFERAEREEDSGS